MSCGDAEKLIQKSLDEPLTSGDRAALDRHCETCSACRTALAEHRQLSNAAKRWVLDVEDVGDAFTSRVMARIDAERRAAILTGNSLIKSSAHVQVMRHGRLRIGFGLVAIAAILVLVAGIFPSLLQYSPLPQFWPLNLHVSFDPAGSFSSLAINAADAGSDLMSEARRGVESSLYDMEGWNVTAWCPYVFLVAMAGNAAFGRAARRRRSSS